MQWHRRGQCCIPQGIFGCWTSPWGEGTFVSFPWGQPRSCFGSMWTCASDIADTSPCWSMQMEQTQEEPWDLVCTSAVDWTLLLSPVCPPHPISTCSPQPFPHSLAPMLDLCALASLWHSTGTSPEDPTFPNVSWTHDAKKHFTALLQQPAMVEHMFRPSTQMGRTGCKVLFIKALSWL